MSSWDQSANERRASPVVVIVALVVALVAGWLFAGPTDPTSSDRAADELDIEIERMTAPGEQGTPLPQVGQRRPPPSAPWDPPARSSWSVLPPAPVGARTGHVVADLDGAVAVWGGYQQERPLRNGALFDPGTGTWKTMRDAPAVERGHVPVEAGNALLLLDEQKPMAYERVLDRWHELAPPPIGEGVVLSNLAAWTGRVAVVLTAEPRGPPGPTLAYEPMRDSWSKLPPPPVDITNDHALVWNARDLLLFGRSDGGAEAFAHRLTFGTSNRPQPPIAGWEAIAPPPLDDGVTRTASARAVASGSVRANDPVYVWVGPRPGGSHDAQLLAYTDSVDAAGGDERWVNLGAPPLNVPVPELVWTGGQVVALASEGAITYQPDEDAFARLPKPGVPLQQQRDTAWTGSLLVSWGGVTGDGAAWRPAEDRDVVDVTSVPDRLSRTCSRVPLRGCPFGATLR